MTRGSFISDTSNNENSNTYPQSGFAYWKSVAIHSWKEASDDNIGLIAAGVAFYAFLAFVPLLAAVVLTYGLAADPETVANHITAMAKTLPESSATLISSQLEGIVETNSEAKGFGLLIALGVALFGARKGAGSIVTALSIAYDENDGRSFVKQTLLSLGITAMAALAGIFAVLALTMMAALVDIVPGISAELAFLSKMLTYALLFVGGTVGAGLLYRFGPDRPKVGWRYLLPGSLFASLGWLLLTLGFGIYVANFGSYNATYGSLGAVVVLLTWIYLSAYVLLLGAELNEAVERHAGLHGGYSVSEG